MKISEALTLAEILRDSLLPSYWKIQIRHSMEWAGRCNFDKTLIQLSAEYITKSSEDDVREVVLHEIAHALLPAEAGHSKRWADTVRKLGGHPKVLVNPFNSWEGTGLYFLAVGFSIVYAIFNNFGQVTGSIVIAIIAFFILRKIWRRYGPVRQVYNLETDTV